MSNKYSYKPARSSCLTLVALIALLSLILNVAIVYVLLFAVQEATKQLDVAADDIAAFEEAEIEYTVKINQMVPIDTEIDLNQEIAIPINLGDLAANGEFVLPVNLESNKTVPVNTTIPLNSVISVPFEVDLETLFADVSLAQDVLVPFSTDGVVSVDTAISNGAVDVPLDIEIVKEFTVNSSVLGQIITIPISLDISETIIASSDLPQDNSVDIPLNVSIGDLASSDSADTLVVPFPSFGDMLAELSPEQRVIELNIPIELNQEIPVDVDIPVSLLLEEIPIDLEQLLPTEATEFTIPLNQSFPIATEVPIVMDVPIKIAVSETPFGENLNGASAQMKATAKQLRPPLEIPTPNTLIQGLQNSWQIAQEKSQAAIDYVQGLMQ